ncbi:MAG: peptidase MA family metallohydrolase [Dehalococcoidia bacterium]|nr:peptidase MA family metallohydrolase [Dehalococcoidia bacterium]
MRRLAFVLFLAILAVSLGQALAQGEIRVISQSYENRFPKEIGFQLKAEGDRDIQKITFFYQIGSSKSTAYAYPTFTPGRTVQAQYVLSTSGTHYLVPGSLLQYYYEIEDASGAKLKTEPTKFTYEDTRFTWQKLEGNQVTVYWYSQESVARQVLQVAQDTLAKMKTSAGESLQRPVKVYIYASKRDMDVALPFQSQTSTQKLVTEGEAFSEADLVMILGSDPEVKPTTAHEITHLITDQLTSNPFAGIPTWLNEGLSMYAEGNLRSVNQNALNDAIRRNTLLSLRIASSMPGKPDQVNLFYGEAYSVVRYLVDTFGAEKMAQLLAAFKEGTTADQALKKVYGFDVDGLEANWRASIGAPPPAAAAAQGGQAQPEKVPTLVPFGAQPATPFPATGASQAQIPVTTYMAIAAGVVVVLIALSLVLVFARRR